MRTNHPRWECDNAAEAVAAMQGFLDRRGRFLEPDARSHADASVRAEINLLDERGCPPGSVIDANHLENRVRRWIGCRTTRWNGFAFPLYSVVGAESAFAAGRESRRRGELFRRLMDRSPVVIAGIDTTKDGLPPNPNARRDFAAALAEKVKTDPDAREALARRIAASAGTGSDSPGARRDHTPTPVDELVDRAGSGSVAFDLFDTGAMAEAANHYFELDERARQDLGNSCAAFAWLAEIDVTAP